MRLKPMGLPATAATLLVVFVSACSTGVEAPSGDAGLATGTSTAPTLADQVTTPSSTEVPPTTATSTPTPRLPTATPFPAPTVPILNFYEFDQPVWAPVGFDDELVMGHGMGIARLDVTSGAITTDNFVAAGERKAEVFYATSDGTRYLAVVDVLGQGTLDTFVSVDPETLARTGTISSEPLGVMVGPMSGPMPREVIASVKGAGRLVDVDTMTVGEVVIAGDTSTPLLRSHWNRGEFWIWSDDGTVVVTDSSGAVRASVMLNVQFSGLGSSVELLTDESFWFADHVGGVLYRVERSDYSQTHVIDLHDHFDWADGLVLSDGDPNLGFVLVNAFVGSEGWWLLVGIDHLTGEVTSEHVIATDSFEYGWNAFERPQLASVGDRVFVRDHLRRIVEIDLNALSEPSNEAWSDPGLSRTPTLSEDEQQVADLTLRFIAAEDDAPSINKPDVLGDSLERLVEGQPRFSEWEIYGVGVDGDRAWVRASGPIEEVGGFFVFERVDGEWLIEAESLCWLALRGPCEQP